MLCHARETTKTQQRRDKNRSSPCRRSLALHYQDLYLPSLASLLGTEGPHTIPLSALIQLTAEQHRNSGLTEHPGPPKESQGKLSSMTLIVETDEGKSPQPMNLQPARLNLTHSIPPFRHRMHSSYSHQSSWDLKAITPETAISRSWASYARSAFHNFRGFVYARLVQPYASSDDCRAETVGCETSFGFHCKDMI